ncbi:MULTISPECIES: ELWxxDGT repeat protein [unclassified Corallococcus]|uniref:ELWxxDGT repeat protein n=1 Tax=unclassified Corallococcus TaxID=2685029 RepID=UPI001A8E968C|nr:MULTISPECIES: ELWxxDGT repeat protein [unclassified Corallococcus]MBN9684220.1 hypothetical protein [Corallococcus sp. NCSPR001]WAS84293.1 hypothetical protein O0N60_34050 [Corallococcus sp. NCRR]
MRMRFGWVLAGVSFVGCGAAQDLELPAAQEPRVQAQACTPAMAATKVKDFLAPGDPLPSPYRPIPSELTNVAGTLYFTVDPYRSTAGLWRSDGTPVGTVPVKEFPYEGPDYRTFESLTAVGSRVFFTMEDPAAGSELWVSDGTSAGTQLVKDITPGASGSSLSDLTALGGGLTFFRRAGSAVELWRSDGTAAGTYRVVDFGSGSSLAYSTLRTGSALLFFLQDATQGTRLWRTDGTAAGTSLVKRVDAGTPLVTGTRALASGDGVFTLDDSSGTEVWRTDGTAAGTVRLDTFGKQVRLLGSLGSSVYLTTLSDDGEQLKLNRLSLSGGGKATVMTLPNAYPGQPDNTPYVQSSAESGGKLYFSMAIGSPGPAPREVGLWVTDGTAGGTQQLSRRLTTADEYSSPLFDTGAGTLLFSSGDGDQGLMPQVTNGTPAGTGRVTLSSPGGNRPEEFTRVGNSIYFRGDSDVWGDALWSVPASVTCTPLSTRAK